MNIANYSLDIYMNMCYSMLGSKGVDFMYRKISIYLASWKSNPYRKPLILQGARQVGKTCSVLAFGREEYENVAYFNFETTPILANTFAESIEPSYLVPILSRICGQTIVREKTLIFF